MKRFLELLLSSQSQDDVAARSTIRRRAPQPLALEQRFMFDGAAVGTVAAVQDAHPVDAGDSHVAAPVPPATAPAADTQRQEIVFIDTSVPNWQALAASVNPHAQTVLLDPQKNELTQIASALSDKHDIDAIHIVSHGAEGDLILGGMNLTADSLNSHTSELAVIRNALSPQGDLLLYGCEIGKGADGLQFLGSLASLTGAGVAASSNDTGGNGGDWVLEQSVGQIETGLFGDVTALASFDNRLSQFNLSGSTGWVPIMFGTSQDPQGDSQAGAADTDIVGDATHGSLYTYYDDNGTATTSDDTLAFRLRIDNPTSTSKFGGVAIVGIDANSDGRIDLFFSVDGRNNGQAIRLLDPGTGANNSPSTTTTSALPTGWLANNGVYSFSSTNYSVVAVSAATDSNWNGNADLGNAGGTDVFVNWRLPMSDIAMVLAKASPTDRNGIYGPRGALGIAGFTKDTTVQYVSFTQTQTGPINGDLNGVGASYDKNASFAALGAITAPMTASAPVAAGPVIKINGPISDGMLNDAEDNSVTLSGTTTSVVNGAPLTLTISDGTHTLTFTNATTVTNNTWSAGNLDLSSLDNGTLTVTASVDPDNNAGTSNSISSNATVLHDKTPPVVAIDTLSSAISGKPVISGSSDLQDGALITVAIDPDNNSATANSLLYQVAVSGGLWSLNTSSAQPTSGTLPGSGLTSIAKVTATATDAAGNSATATMQNRPTVAAQSTNDTTPAITGTWTNIAGDTLTVAVNGVTYTAGDGNLVVNSNVWTLTIPNGNALPAGTYEVLATVTRAGNGVADTSSNEITITSNPTPAIDITGGASVSGSDTTPVISGTSNNAGGYVIVRLDPNNDGDLTDAVTYSVTTDGSGNWTLDTGSAAPISGSVPSSGFIGAVGIRATDSTGAVADTQTLTVSTPTVAIGSITSTASTNSAAQVNNSGAAANYLNKTEDDAVTISGTATGAGTVDVTITDVNGHVVTASNVAVTGGNWSVTGLNLSSLDDGVLTVKATISDTNVSATNTTVTHDKTSPIIDITAQDPLKKTAALITGKTDLPDGTLLTIQIYDGATLKAQWNSIAVSGGAFTTNAVTPNTGSANIGNGGPFTINVYPTSTTTDTAGNIAQMVTETRTGQPNSSSNSIAIGAFAGGDGINTAGEISSGVTISGTTTLTGSPTITVVVTDGSGATVTLTPTASAGTWSTTLTNANIKTLSNGALTITASATETVSGTAYTISDTIFSSLTVPSPKLTITDDTPATATGAVTYTFTFSEAVTGFTASDITVTNGTKGALSGSGTTYTMVITPTASSTGTMTVSVADNMATGTTTGRGNIGATDEQPYVTTGAAAAPTLTINTDNLASSTTPLITGTTNLAAGAPIVIEIDTDNNGSTDLQYSATVKAGGNWSLDIGTATPTSGALPVNGLPTGARITAVATNAYGVSTTVVGLNTPVVNAQVTNDNTPTVTGTWTQIGGDTLSVVVNGVTYSVANGNLNVSATGWSLTPTVSLADATYSVTASVVRSGTTKTDLTTTELTVDTLGSVDITGGVNVTTNDATPVIAGTTSGLPNGTVLTLEIDTDNNGSYDLVYKTAVSGNAWSIDTASAIPYSGSFPAAGLNGSVPLRATASDVAGNAGLDTQTLIVDVTPPDIGITSGNRTPDTTPHITGTTDLPAGTTITIDIDPNNDGDLTDRQTYTTTVQSNGTWAIDATTPLSGTVGVYAKGTDAAGNSSTARQTLVIDPHAPTVAITKPNASIGADNSADAVEDDGIVFNGTSTTIAAGSVISITVTDGTRTISDTAAVDGNGNWTLAPLNLSAMANGTLSVSATYIDNGGNTYGDTFNFAHNKATTIAIDSISEDTGTIADFITKDNTVAVFGSATANAAVAITVKDAGNVTVASFNVSADGNGQWSTAATSALSAGNYTIAATVGGTTATRALTIVDTTAPLLTSSAPADDAANAGINNNLTLNFNKSIQLGSGVINLYRADNTLIESFNVNTLSGSNGGAISVIGSTITLDPGASLTTSTGYFVTIDNGAVTDTAGNAYAGIANATTLNFTTSGSADVTAPATPGIDLLASSDTGISNQDDITGDNTPTLRIALNGSGATAPVAGDVVTLLEGATTVGTATLSAQNISDGYVDITSSLLSDGSKSFTATVTDAANNVSLASTALPVVIDTSAPALTLSLNAITSDGIVNAAEAGGTVAITGTAGGAAADGDTVTLTINGNTYTGTLSSGAFSINVAGSDLAADSDTVVDASISQTDTAGNTGTAATTRSYTTDTAAIVLSSSTPLDDAASVSLNSNITLTFNKSVQLGSGTIELYRADNTLVESFDVGTLQGSNGGTLSRNGSSITLNPAANLGSATGYYLHVGSSAVTDQAGNPYAGISDATTLNFTTSNTTDMTAPAAPSLDLLASSDTGTSNSDDNTADNTPTLRVTLNGSGATAPVVGDVVTLFEGATPVGTAVLSAQNISDGYVDITSSALGDGSKSFSATVTDAASNVSGASAALPVTIDTTAPTLTLSVNSVTADGIVNSAEAAATVAITGAAGGAAADGDTVTLTINGNTYTGLVSSGAFSINVAGSDLASDNDRVIDASVSKTDSAGNVGTATATQGYSVDTTAPNLTLALNTVTADGVVNAAEAAGTIAIAGIAGGDAANGDIVTLTINGNTYMGSVNSGAFSINVAGSDLAADSDHVIDASVSKTDSAGNVATATAIRAFTLDTAAPALSLSLDSITADGSVNTAEAAGTVNITGTTGGDAANGDTVTLTINGNTYTGSVTSGAFSINVAGSDLAADSDHVIDASVSKTDSAGNVGTATATRAYTLDTIAPALSLSLNSVTADGIVNAAEAAGTVAITGTVGGDAANGDTVTLTVNGHTYTGSVNNGSFSINVLGNDLAADADRQIDASISKGDAAGNTGAATAARGYGVDTTAPAPTLTINPIAADDILSAAEAEGSISISGSVQGEANDGDVVTLTINGRNYSGVVSGRVFSIAVPGSDLANEASRTVSITIATTDAAGNAGGATTTRVYSVEAATPVQPVVPPVTNTQPAEAAPLPTPALAVPVTMSTPTITPIVTLATNVVALSPTAEVSFNPLANALWGDPSQRTAAAPSSAVASDLTQARGTSTIGDMLTSAGPNAFRVAVIKSNEETLILFKGIPDQDVETGGSKSLLHFVLPADTFAHTNASAVIQLTARLANGESLPSWLTFNATTGTFEGVAPAQAEGDIEIVITARDNAGREAKAVFRIHVHAEGTQGRAARPSLSELLRREQHREIFKKLA